MRVLLTIPHVFAPQAGSRYSSQNESKRTTKQLALQKSTIENLHRHGKKAWVHASLGLEKQIVTRHILINSGIDLTIQIYSPSKHNLINELPKDDRIQIIDPDARNYSEIPMIASRRLIEQAEKYDLIGYMEDDLLIEDPEFFQKINYLDSLNDGSYIFLPHRCEFIPNRGDVILSGDPDGGRPDLFWDTGETLNISWPSGNRRFYRATNPHSGCYFMTRRQGLRLLNHWAKRSWKPDFVLSGPLEQAASGLLLPVFKVMKTIPEDYRFLMLRHLDRLWENHSFE